MATNVFEDGDIEVEQVLIQSSPPKLPKPLLVLSPTVAGAYPVILFFHGFLIPNTSYSKLLHHIASHGYIIVVPQGLPLFGRWEVECAAHIVNWIGEGGLQPSLSRYNVEAQLENFVLAGHSKGGKSAFSVALGSCKIQLNLKIKVLLGIDPVAGVNKTFRFPPEILTYKPESFNLEMPVLVIGTGLGPEKAYWFLPWSCAPDGVNHKEFYNECKAPCVHFVTTEYGHLDMLDDGARTPRCECKGNNHHRDLMRKTVSGLVVAFLRAYLKAQFKDLDIIENNWDLAPATLDRPEYRKNDEV